MSSSIRSIKTLGLAGLMVAMATVVVASVGVVSASAALPEFSKWGKCTQKFGGVNTWNYTESTCKTKSATPWTGEWALSPFTSTSGKGKLVTVGGRVIECSGDSNLGEIVGPKKVIVRVIFTGCKGPSASTCTTKGANAGEIITRSLEGELGYIKKAAPVEVGIDLKPEAPATQFAEFECLTLGFGPTIKVTGSVICPISPVNTPETKFTLSCKQASGVQAPTHFEGGAEDVLFAEGEGFEGFAKEQAGEETTDAITTSESGEIKA